MGVFESIVKIPNAAPSLISERRLRGSGGGRLHVRDHDFGRSGRLEGALARQELERHDPERVHVGQRVHVAALALLGGHIRRCAEGMTGPRLVAQIAMLREKLGDPEVEELRKRSPVAVSRNEHVGRFEVAVGDAHLMGGVERRRHRLQDRPRFRLGERAAFLEVDIQRLAVEPLHDEILTAVLQLTEREDIDDVLVPDPIDRAGFRYEAGDDRGVGGHVSRQHLDGDPFFDGGLDPPIDGTEGTPPQDSLDDVLAHAMTGRKPAPCRRVAH